MLSNFLPKASRRWRIWRLTPSRGTLCISSTNWRPRPKCTSFCSRLTRSGRVVARRRSVRHSAYLRCAAAAGTHTRIVEEVAAAKIEEVLTAGPVASMMCTCKQPTSARTCSTHGLTKSILCPPSRCSHPVPIRASSYSPECLEGEFCELPLYGGLRS
jgi:hypothetical protein